MDPKLELGGVLVSKFQV